ncbi:MAG: type II methionyl aminopeptidase [Candidatus Caldarchaeum sp.]
MTALDCLLKAGEVARQVRAEVPSIVKPGMTLLEIVESVEELIKERGCSPAFPCNISIDDVAAHYSPPPNDPTVLPKNSVVKIDFGVAVDGYVADTAVTVTDTALGELLKKAVEEALKAAVKTVAAGVKVSAVGAVIQNTLARYGVKPIRNLTGHEIQRYNLHAGVSIPNVAAGDGAKLQQGHVYAIEPFATVLDAAGEVVNTEPATIFRLEAAKASVRMSAEESKLLSVLAERFHGLPYSLRWLSDLGFDVSSVHQRLVRQGRVKPYPMLVERTGRPVAQAEHTIVVERDGCTVVT